MIRPANKEDYKGIFNLLAQYKFNAIPDVEELFSGKCFVAEEDKKIVGFLWALVAGKMAFIDYLVVDEKYRFKTKVGRSKIGLELASFLFLELTKSGVTKFAAIIGQREESHSMLRFYRNTLGMAERKVLTVLNGYPKDVLAKIKESLC